MAEGCEGVASNCFAVRGERFCHSKQVCLAFCMSMKSGSASA